MAQFDIWNLVKANQQAGIPVASVSGDPFLPSQPGAAAISPSPQPPLKVKSMSISTGGGNPSQAKYGDQFDDAFKKSMEARGVNLEALKAKLAEQEMKQPDALQSLNLRPFLQMADNLNGTKNSFNYAAPTAKEDHAALVQKLQDNVQKQENGLSDDQLNYLKMKATEQSADKRLQMSLGAQERAASRGQQNGENALRKEFLGSPIYKSAIEYDKIARGISENPADNGASQQAMVYQFMKMLDEGSVVRETEFAMAARNAGKGSQWSQAWENFKSGKQLTPEQVVAMKQVASQLTKSYGTQLQTHKKTYKELANSYGYSPDRVVLNSINLGEDSPSGNTPKPGEVINGYKFLGGDPNAESSWTVVK